MSHVQQLLALTSSSCLMGAMALVAAALLAQTVREVCGKAWLKLLHILDLQNKRKILSLSVLVDLGPHHSPRVTFQRCPHLSEHTAPPASLLLVPNQVQRNKFKKKQKQNQTPTIIK